MSSPILIEIESTDSIESAAGKIPLQPDVIIFLLGSFDPSIAAQVRSVCARAVAPVALLTKALLVDNGSSQGLAAQMGEAAQQMDQSPSLLGIFDQSVAAQDQNHTHLVKLPVEWTDPEKSKLLLIAELAKQGDKGPKPVVALLFGGNDADKITVLRCARRGWPIMAIKGSGGLADAILTALAPQAAGAAAAPAIADPEMQEILDTATLGPLPLDGKVDDLKRALLGPIQQPGDVLADAWGRYNDLDLAANEKQGQYRRLQVAILSLGVMATLFAVVISGNALSGEWRKALIQNLPWIPALHLHQALRVLLILVPITASILVSFNSRFREGNKWILLRAAAEAIKREIFRYRMRSGVYSDDSAQSKLADNVKEITDNLVQSEVNKSSLPRREVKDASCLGFLQPDAYLRDRIDDQVTYFEKTTASLYGRLRRFQVYILLAGGFGTFLAAMDASVWVALTTALAAAFTTKLETDQVEGSIVQYNVALTSLRNIESWWKALSPWEKTRPKNIDLLVDQTEITLQHETAGWVQQMQSELDKLTEKQTDSSQTSADAAKQ